MLKEKTILKAVGCFVCMVFLWVNCVWASGIAVNLAPSTNLPVLYRDVAPDLIFLESLGNLNKEKLEHIRFFLGRDNVPGIRYFTAPSMSGDGWAFYAIDLAGNRIIRYVSRPEVDDKFFDLLSGIDESFADSGRHEGAYEIDGRSYPKTVYPTTSQIRPFVEKCAAKMPSIPTIEQTILAAYPDEIEWVKDHAVRVAKIAEIIADRMELGDGQVELVRIAALAHDLGKGASQEMIAAINDPVSRDVELLQLHSQYSVDILRELRFDIDEKIYEIVKNHHTPWKAKSKISKTVAEIIYFADQIDASQDTGRPYKDTMTDIKTLREQFRRDYKINRRVSKRPYKAVHLLLSAGQSVLRDIIYQSRAGKTWNEQISESLPDEHHHHFIKESSGDKLMYQITLDRDGNIVTTDTIESSDLYREEYVTDAVALLQKAYGGAGITSGIDTLEIRDRKGPVGAQADSKATMDIDVFRDKNLVVEVLEHEALHKILALVLPDNPVWAEVVVRWYSVKRFLGLSESDQGKIISILKDTSNGLDPEGSYAKFLKEVSSKEINEDELITEVAKYVQTDFTAIDIQNADEKLQKAIDLLNQWIAAGSIVQQTKTTESAMLKTIRNMAEARALKELSRLVDNNLLAQDGFSFDILDAGLFREMDDTQFRHLLGRIRGNNREIAITIFNEEEDGRIGRLARENGIIVVDNIPENDSPERLALNEFSRKRRDISEAPEVRILTTFENADRWRPVLGDMVKYVICGGGNVTISGILQLYNRLPEEIRKDLGIDPGIIAGSRVIRETKFNKDLLEREMQGAVMIEISS